MWKPSLVIFFIFGSVQRSDASKNINTPENCFIVETKVVIQIESETDTVLSDTIL